jgi:hypothetical protein
MRGAASPVAAAEAFSLSLRKLISLSFFELFSLFDEEELSSFDF